MARWWLCVCIVVALCVQVVRADARQEVGKWQRFEAGWKNPSWEGNPFDLEFTGKFTSPSGRELEQIGFYAGEDTWEIYFMPDETGVWRFQTRSPDPELDGHTGSFRCVESDLPGVLQPAGSRWELSDSGADYPVIWAPPRKNRWWAFRSLRPEDPLIRRQLDFAQNTVGARLLSIGDLALAPRDWAKDLPQSACPYVVGKEGERFYLPFWERLNAKLDEARERGMGIYIMFFTDDALKPDTLGIRPRSKAEKRLFRYAVARLSCYPILLWDSGIDISEYRSNEWIDWYARWFNEHDPWRHPVGSRSAGGSGGKHPETGTYYSYGKSTIPSRNELLQLLDRKEPTAFTDHWRPFINRGNWTHEKIRKVVWCCALSGGPAPFPDYSQGFSGDASREEVVRGAHYVGYATRFLREQLRRPYAELLPHDELIEEGRNAILAASPGREYVLYDESGGKVTLDLPAGPTRFKTVWHNPRTGRTIEAKTVNADGKTSFTSPSTGQDWVLHLYKASD